MHQDFIDAMISAGIGPANPSQITADDTRHRYEVEGDRKGTKNGVYQLAVDGDFAFGWFMSHKQGEVHKWHSKGKRKATDEEKADWKAKLADAKARAETQRKEAADAATAEAREIWATASRDGVSEYCTRKGITLKAVRYDGADLIVPMWRGGDIVAVQRIKPDGGKWFQKGSDHVGAYYSIKGDADVIAICEGVATGAVVHRLTGWSVVCAFNAGNLKPVAKSIRDKYPDARIVFAADNDHETALARPELGNVGMVKAQQAAVAIGGAQVIAPDSVDGVSDWDDFARACGDDAARDGLMGRVASPVDDRDYEPDDIIEEDDPLDIIRPLGHNRGEYYFFPRSTGQIMSFSATSLSKAANLYQLATKGFWLRMYAPEESMGAIADYAAAELIAECHRKGVFSIENARGVGVWRDGGKYLVNCGDVLIGEGVRMHPSEYDGDSVYEAGPRVIDLDVDALSATDGSEFLEICKSFLWKRPQYGILLAGWITISSVGGALRWRPHISVTGPRGSGKSFLMDNLLTVAVGSIAIKLDGGTTEAGVRKAIGLSSRPFIMDEAESENARDRAEMEKVFHLFRKASSGGKVANFNSEFIARFCACISAINPRIEQGADESRNTQLELVAHKGDREQFKRLRDNVKRVVTPDFSSRLFARTISQLDVIIDNIAVFEDALADEFGSARDAEQIAPMVAGAYSLTSSKRIDYAFAKEWITRQDWQWRQSSNDETDAERLVSFILSARVRYDYDGMGRESTVGELIHKCMDGETNAVKGLGGYGIKVDAGRLVVSNSASSMKRILDATPWGVWKRTLSDYPDADNCGNRAVYFGPGITSKATSIPLMAAIGGAQVGDGDIEMEGF